VFSLGMNIRGAIVGPFFNQFGYMDMRGASWPQTASIMRGWSPPDHRWCNLGNQALEERPDCIGQRSS